MAEKDIADILNQKSQDLRNVFKDIEASLEQWKFSVEESKEGTRVEIQIKALIKKKEKQQ